MGQRPMSKCKSTMPVVANESGAEDLLLRTLCAHNLPETKPELQGWVDREKVRSITGRSRKPQMALVDQFGFEEYVLPGGGGGRCFLIDPNYSVKLRDLWVNRGDKQSELDDIMRLKVGQHVRPDNSFQLIVSHEEGETRFLSSYKKQFKTICHSGPLTIIDGGKLDQQQLELSCAIMARYSKGRDEGSVELLFSNPDQTSHQVYFKPMTIEEIPKEWLLA
jgi:tRNA-specific 2-thiouridylase